MTSRKLNFEPLTFCIMYILFSNIPFYFVQWFSFWPKETTPWNHNYWRKPQKYIQYTRGAYWICNTLCYWAKKEEVKMDQAAAAKALAYTIYIPVLDFFKRYFRVARARRRDIIQQLFIHLPCLEDLWVVSRRNSHIIDIWYICLNPAWTTKYQKNESWIHFCGCTNIMLASIQSLNCNAYSMQKAFSR